MSKQEFLDQLRKGLSGLPHALCTKDGRKRTDHLPPADPAQRMAHPKSQTEHHGKKRGRCLPSAIRRRTFPVPDRQICVSNWYPFRAETRSMYCIYPPPVPRHSIAHHHAVHPSGTARCFPASSVRIGAHSENRHQTPGVADPPGTGEHLSRL